MGGFKLYFPIEDEDKGRTVNEPTTPSTSSRSKSSDDAFCQTLGDSASSTQPVADETLANSSTQLSKDPMPGPLLNPFGKMDHYEAVAQPMAPCKEAKTYREHTTECNKRQSLSIQSLEEAADADDEPSQELNFRSYVGGRRRSSAQRSADYYAFMDGEP